MDYPKPKFGRRDELTPVIKTGFGIFKNKRNYLDRMTVPGHFPIGFTGRRQGPFVEALDSKRKYYFDATNYWMTLPIDVGRHFGKNTKLQTNIGFSLLNAGSTSEFGSVALAAFVARMKRLWPRMNRILPFNSGTQATDAALKWAMAMVMHKNKLKPKDMKVVSLESGFHGRCGMGLEATRKSKNTEDYQTYVTPRIPNPFVVFEENGFVDMVETENNVTRALDKLTKYFAKPSTAALIIEYPMVAEGGAEKIAPEFLIEARRLCDKHGKFLIVDCIQMFGKSGNWFPREVKQVADAICVGKYSRVCAAMLTDPTKRKFDDYAGIPGKFGATWFGHDAAMISTLAIMDVIDKNKLFVNGVKMAKKFYSELKKMTAKGMRVERPRIVGTYVGFDIRGGRDKRDKVISRLQKEGVLALPAGEVSIRFAPRLDTKEWEIEYFLEKLQNSLKRL